MNKPRTKGRRIVAIIQARMGSTRLPGKVMEDLAGQPMLVRVVDRTRRAKTLDCVVVATTRRPEDDIIVKTCLGKNYHFFRGSVEDVLDRYYRAASVAGANIVVRITSDCPLIEPDIIDRIVAEFLQHPGVDYASNILERTFPRGLDVEVFSFGALRRAWAEDKYPVWREHVTTYIQRRPGKFSVYNVAGDADYSSMRWTVDTSQDLEFIRRIYNYFQNDTFHWTEVLGLLNSHPDWLEINQNVQQKVVK
jgi:spore coat polysaccharide biosynthesis protein SpsF